MEINEFIEKFAEEIDVEEVDDLTPETEFRNLDEWSSLAMMLTIAFINDNFGKKIVRADIEECLTLQDLYNISMRN